MKKFLKDILSGQWVTDFTQKNRRAEDRQDLKANSSLHERRIEGLLKFNQSLVDMLDENDFMNKALQIITEISGATAVSFVSLDEWGQTLPAYARGSLPEAMLKGWAEHVISERTQKLCSVCFERVAPPGKTCPLLQGAFLEHFGVYCLPLQRGERLLGMLNLYYPAGKGLEPDLRSLLEGLLNVLIVAVTSIRLREQEHATIRHIQMARNSGGELSGQLLTLLQSIRQTVNADYIRLQVRDSEFGQANIRIEDGDMLKGYASYYEHAAVDVLDSGKAYFSTLNATPPDYSPSLLVLPLNNLSGNLLGVILVAGGQVCETDVSSNEVVKGIIDQIIGVLETEKYLLSLEYRMVIQERSRLAREIHDSLAQTLAYLKLQTAQMLNLTKQKEYNRLNSMLELHYHSLSEAYLDTREAIDNLRLKPEQDLKQSLEMTAENFEENTGIRVIRKFDLPVREIPIEVQAQLIRIVQEALNNVRKHSKARQVTIAAKMWEDSLILEVQDDGIGFQPPDILVADQHGLRGMRERAELIGADFQLENAQGSGTIVRLRLPLLEETRE